MMAAAARLGWTLRAAAIVLLLLGGMAGMSCQDSAHAAKVKQTANPPGTVYTCTTHPQIRRLKAGHCPICHKELVAEK